MKTDSQHVSDGAIFSTCLNQLDSNPFTVFRARVILADIDVKDGEHLADALNQG